MISYSSAVTVARPADVVFPYLVEPQKQALWSDVEMRPLTDGPYVQGSRMDLTFGMGPLKTSLQVEFSQVQPASLVTWATVSSGPVQWQGEYRLEPEAGGTRLSQSGTLTFRGLWRLVEPVIGAEMRQGAVKELEKLRTVAEAGASS